MAQRLKILWTRSALRHLSEAYNYIEIDSPAAAQQQIDRIELSLARIRSFPMMGRAGARPGTREFPIPGTSYLLLYRVREDALQVLAVLHGSTEQKTQPDVDVATDATPFSVS